MTLVAFSILIKCFHCLLTLNMSKGLPNTCSKPSIKTRDQWMNLLNVHNKGPRKPYRWHRSSVFIVNFKQIKPVSVFIVGIKCLTTIRWRQCAVVLGITMIINNHLFIGSPMFHLYTP